MNSNIDFEYLAKSEQFAEFTKFLKKLPSLTGR